MEERGLRAIMLVEDEGLIRQMLAEEFADAGFDVIEAGSADEAVELLEGGIAVEAVVTDVQMPGRINGLGLATWLRNHHPKLPILVTSGYATREEASAANPAIAAVITKPYVPAHVVALVDEALIERRTARTKP